MVKKHLNKSKALLNELLEIFFFTFNNFYFIYKLFLQVLINELKFFLVNIFQMSIYNFSSIFFKNLR